MVTITQLLGNCISLLPWDSWGAGRARGSLPSGAPCTPTLPPSQPRLAPMAWEPSQAHFKGAGKGSPA